MEGGKVGWVEDWKVGRMGLVEGKIGTGGFFCNDALGIWIGANFKRAFVLRH